MKIEELVALTDGLSVPCGGGTLVCDRTRIVRHVARNAIGAPLHFRS